jgi:type IV pilus assembly protein PilV
MSLQHINQQPMSPQRGFSLVEVLVALIIIGVGMLGIAKIQALAYASTGTAASRSIAVIEASSLASAMRANRDYWTTAAATVTQTITISAGSVTASTDATLTAAANCSGAICDKVHVAAYDVQSWATTLNTVLQGSTATVNCYPPNTANNPAPNSTYPVSCVIQVKWNERNIGVNTQSQGTTMAQPTYTLYVEP